MGLILWLEPIKISERTQTTLNISLQQPQTKTETPTKRVSKTKEEPKIEAKPKPKTKTSPLKEQTEPVTDTIPKPVKPAKQTTPTISTGQIFNQAKAFTDVQITDEFKTGQQVDIQQPAIKVHDPYADIPYLPVEELAVDMKFYSAGYRGDIERFFDKVILTKTFTTKYGTKINCALAVIVVCGWK